MDRTRRSSNDTPSQTSTNRRSRCIRSGDGHGVHGRIVGAACALRVAVRSSERGRRHVAEWCGDARGHRYPVVRGVRSARQLRARHALRGRCRIRPVEWPRRARVLRPQDAGEDRGRRQGREDGRTDAMERNLECHWAIASYDPTARPSRAHARPSSVSAEISSDCTSQSAWTDSITLTSGSCPDA